MHAFRRLSVIALISTIGCNGPSSDAENHSDTESLGIDTPGRSDEVQAGGAPAIEVQQRAFIDKGKSPERIPTKLIEIFDFVSRASGYYSKATSAEAVLRALGEAAGFMHASPTQDDQLRDLKLQLDKVAADIKWQIQSEFAADRYSKAAGAFLNAKQARDSGTPMDRSWSGWQNSIDVVIAAEAASQTLRMPHEGAISGKWTDIVPNRAQSMDADGRIYDWRLGLPVLIQLINLRLQLIAAVDPTFRFQTVPGTADTSVYAEEFLRMRGRLLEHYVAMQANVHCGKKFVTPRQYMACADVNTGVSVVTDEAQYSSEAYLKHQVESHMPLFQVRDLAATLGLYSNVSYEDLTSSSSIIATSDVAPFVTSESRECLNDNGEGMAGVGRCNSVLARWTYSRETKEIKSQFSGMCLSSVFHTASAMPCDGNMGQKWTYDPIDGTILNGTNRYLNWDTAFDDEGQPYRRLILSTTPRAWHSRMLLTRSRRVVTVQGPG